MGRRYESNIRSFVSYHQSWNERKTIFLDEPDRGKFLSLIGEYHDRYGIVLHAYVLMDNHIILELRGNLLKVMHGLNIRYTGYFNRKNGRVGHLFQADTRPSLLKKTAILFL